HGAVLLEDLLDCGVEEFLLRLEVVVEGAEPDIGGVGDLLDAHCCRIARGEQTSRRRDERSTGAGFPSVQPVAGSFGHDRSLSARDAVTGSASTARSPPSSTRSPERSGSAGSSKLIPAQAWSII